MHRDTGWLDTRDRYLKRILFIIDDDDPEVDIEWAPLGGKGVPSYERHHYTEARHLAPDAPLDDNREFAVRRHAAIILSDVLFALRDVLGPLEHGHD